MRIDLREVEMEVTLKRVLEGMLEPAIEDRLDARRALAVLTESSSVGAPSLGGSRWSRGSSRYSLDRAPMKGYEDLWHGSI